jgi:hypothetical protein
LQIRSQLRRWRWTRYGCECHLSKVSGRVLFGERLQWTYGLFEKNSNNKISFVCRVITTRQVHTNVASVNIRLWTRRIWTNTNLCTTSPWRRRVWTPNWSTFASRFRWLPVVDWSYSPNLATIHALFRVYLASNKIISGASNLCSNNSYALVSFIICPLSTQSIFYVYLFYPYRCYFITRYLLPVDNHHTKSSNPATNTCTWRR